MKVSADLYASVTDRVGNIQEIVDREFLGDHVDDLVSRGNIGLILVGHELIDLFAGDLIIRALAYDIAAGLQALDMVTRDPNIDFTDLQVGVGAVAVIQGHPDSLDGLIDIQYLPVLDPIGVGTSES